MKFDKKMPIKSCCNKCNHVERYTVFEYIMKEFAQVMMVLGFFVFILVLYFGPNLAISSFMNFNTYHYAKQHHDDLRDLALNLTDVGGNDPFVFADSLAEGLGDIRYVLPSPFETIQDPFETYEKGGDCKNTAIFFSAMMTTMGFKSYVICDIYEYDHCVSKIKGRDDFEDMYMIMDLASRRAETYYNNQVFWNDSEIPVWSKVYI